MSGHIKHLGLNIVKRPKSLITGGGG